MKRALIFFIIIIATAAFIKQTWHTMRGELVLEEVDALLLRNNSKNSDHSIDVKIKRLRIEGTDIEDISMTVNGLKTGINGTERGFDFRMDGWAYFWVIYNPSSRKNQVASLLSREYESKKILLPHGYTHEWLLSAWRVDRGKLRRELHESHGPKTIRISYLENL